MFSITYLVVALAFTALTLGALVLHLAPGTFRIDVPQDGSAPIIAVTAGLAAFGWVGYLVPSMTGAPDSAFLAITVFVMLTVVDVVSRLTRSLVRDGR